MIYHGKCATQHKHLMAYGVYHFLNLLGSSKCLLLLQLIYGRNHCSCLSCLSYRSYHLLRCNLSCATTTSSEATTDADAFFLPVPAASFFHLDFFPKSFFLIFLYQIFFNEDFFPPSPWPPPPPRRPFHYKIFKKIFFPKFFIHVLAQKFGNIIVENNLQ